MEIYEQGVLTEELPPQLQRKMREASYTQLGYFAELQVFYSFFPRVFNDSGDKQLNDAFATTLADLLQNRTLAREILDSDWRRFVVKDWHVGTEAATRILDLQEAVGFIQRESARLNTIATIYRSNL